MSSLDPKISVGTTPWGSVTGAIANQTDLNSSLTGKQTALAAIWDIHNITLTNNTANNILTVPLTSGQTVGFMMDGTILVKKSTDWAIAVFQGQVAFYNDGSSLLSTSQSISASDNTSNSGAVTAGLGSTPFSGTLAANVVTVKFNPGDWVSGADSFVLSYTVHNPPGRAITFL